MIQFVTRSARSAIIAAVLFASSNVYAEKFANQFAEFELPPNWACQLEGAEWVCQSGDPAKKKEAIIVLAAKLKGDMDSLEQYMSHLKSVKTFTSAAGKPMKSEPRKTEFSNINGQSWVDSLHLESEIAGFYTRYLATVKDDIGILITYSIAKNKYQEYVSEFETMVKTLKVFRRDGGINVNPANTNLFAGGESGRKSVLQENTVFGDTKVDVDGGASEEGAGRKKTKSDELQTYLLFAVAAAAGFFILKKRKK